MKEDFFQKAYKEAVRRQKALRFLKWAEETHPEIISKFKDACET